MINGSPDLLLEGDGQESIIDACLNRGDMSVLYGQVPVSVCIGDVCGRRHL